MDSHDGAMNDIFVDHVMRATNTSVYKIRVESSVAESCSSFGWAACRACFAGMRAVKECLAVVFCPKPAERLAVHFYKSRTSNERLRQLTIPLLSEPKRCSEKPGPVKGFRIEDSGDSELSVDIIFWNDMSHNYESSSPQQPSMPYQSLPGYNSDLSSSDSEGPL